MIENLREIADKSRAPFIFVGEEALPDKLARVERVYGRVISWVPAQPVDLEDCRKLAQRAGVTVDDEVLETIRRASEGRARIVVSNLNLARQFAAFAEPWSASLGYRPSAAERVRIAPTEVDPWRGRLLVGEVHDENAAQLDGVAAHAGLFGSVEDVAAFARLGSAPIGVHLKVDTGMGRLGAPPYEIDRVLEALASHRELRLDGLMTHFACADGADLASTEEQLRAFHAIVR